MTRPDIEAMRRQLDVMWQRLTWVFIALGLVVLADVPSFLWQPYGFGFFVLATAFFVYRFVLWTIAAVRESRLRKAVDRENERILWGPRGNGAA